MKRIALIAMLLFSGISFAQKKLLSYGKVPMFILLLPTDSIMVTKPTTKPIIEINQRENYVVLKVAIFVE
jgi:hypothetical protein